MSLQEAQFSFGRGDYVTAEKLYRSAVLNDPIVARRGLTRSLVQLEALDKALSTIELNLNSGSSEDVGLYADVLGKQGNRSEAEALLTRFAQESPAPYILAVLGEQQIRQGEWKTGTKVMGSAIRMDPNGSAADHVRDVVSDLSIALSNQRLPAEIGLKFVDRLINTAPRDSAIFDDLRSARSAMAREQPWSSTETNQSSGPDSRSRPPASPPPRKRLRGPDGGATRANAPKRMSHVIPELGKIMRRDRQLNEELQATVVNPGLPEWPSERDKLDLIPLQRPQLLGFEVQELKKSSVRLTTGSITNEIMIERATDNLLAEATRFSTLPLPYSSQGLVRVEVMAWDGILDRVSELPDLLAQDEKTKPDIRLLALAGYFGNLIEKSFQGVWQFQTPISKSVLHVGDNVAQPFAWASEWLSSPDSDSVDLMEMWNAAAAASTSTTSNASHVDETEELSDTSLKMRLAELWLEYVGRPSDRTREVAESIQILQEMTGGVAFAVSQDFAPKRVSKNPFGTVHGLVVLGYSRLTGDFYCLNSTKHMAYYLNDTVPLFGTTNRDSVVTMLDVLHCPGISISQGSSIRDGEGGSKILDLAIAKGGKRYSWELEFSPRRRQKWSITLTISNLE